MAEQIGQGVIELSADSTKLEAGVEKARRSLRGLRKEAEGLGEKESRSIDRYIQKLKQSADTMGMSRREADLYKLTLRGATSEQLKSADAALRMTEAYERHDRLSARLTSGMKTVATYAAAAAAAMVAGAIAAIQAAGNYTDLAEKIGDTARNVSSLKDAADNGGVSLDQVASASVRLTSALSKTDDESKNVGAAITALGLNFRKFKDQSPIEQLESLAQAMAEFEDGAEKTAVAVALFGRAGADLLPFLKEYAKQGRDAAFLSEEQAAAADAAADAMTRLKTQVQIFFQVAAVNLLPLLSQIGEALRVWTDDTDTVAAAHDALRGVLNGLLVPIQTLIVLGSDLAFIWRGVGRELASIDAQLAKLRSGDWSGMNKEAERYNELARLDRKRLDDFQKRVLDLRVPAPKFEDPRILGPVGTVQQQARAMGSSVRPRLDASGLSTEKDPKEPKAAAAKRGQSEARKLSEYVQEQRVRNIQSVVRAAERESKEIEAFNRVVTNAQLASFKTSVSASQDVIRRESEILEARRAANLVTTRDYFEQRRSLIQRDATEQVRALEEERRILVEQDLVGRERVERDVRVNELTSQVARIRVDTVNALTVTAIQEGAAVDSLAERWRQAQEAASEYLESIRRGNARELEGMGKGRRVRERDAGLRGIDNKFAEREADLARDNRNGKFKDDPDGYQRELALLRSVKDQEKQIWLGNFADIQAARQSFFIGAAESLNNYFDESRSTFEQIGGLVQRSFKGMEDALVSFVTTGKLDFKSLADSIIQDMIRIAVQRAVLGPIAGMLGSVLGFGGGRALGGPVNPGKIYEVGEGNKPELLRSGGRTFLIPGNQGRVIPTEGGAQAGGRNVTVAPSYTINIDSRTDQSQVRLLVERAVRTGNARLVDQLQVAGRL